MKLGVDFVQTSAALERVQRAIDLTAWQITFSKGAIDVGWVIVINPVNDPCTGYGITGRHDSMDFHFYKLEKLTRPSADGKYTPETVVFDSRLQVVLDKLTEVTGSGKAAPRQA